MPQSLIITYADHTWSELPYDIRVFKSCFRSSRVIRITDETGRVFLDHVPGQTPYVNPAVLDLA